MAGCAVPTAMSGVESARGDNACVYGVKSRSNVCKGDRPLAVMDVTLSVLSYDVVSSVAGVGSNG